MMKNIFLKLIYGFLLFSFSYSFAQIDAVTESLPIIVGTAAVNTPSVLTNDTLNGQPVSTGTVTLPEPSQLVGH